jgi:hypothetical protein
MKINNKILYKLFFYILILIFIILNITMNYTEFYGNKSEQSTTAAPQHAVHLIHDDIPRSEELNIKIYDSKLNKKQESGEEVKKVINFGSPHDLFKLRGTNPDAYNALMRSYSELTAYSKKNPSFKMKPISAFIYLPK